MNPRKIILALALCTVLLWPLVINQCSMAKCFNGNLILGGVFVLCLLTLCLENSLQVGNISQPASASN